ncbi:hypothetical protein HanPSC8_Chr01g0032331 [Helianthus annuus]|nr:hypothetical protein HanPSC8_Chr01g0032331 [Helianthus annuus]
MITHFHSFIQITNRDFFCNTYKSNDQLFLYITRPWNAIKPSHHHGSIRHPDTLTHSRTYLLNSKQAPLETLLSRVTCNKIDTAGTQTLAEVVTRNSRHPFVWSPTLSEKTTGVSSESQAFRL